MMPMTTDRTRGKFSQTVLVNNTAEVGKISTNDFKSYNNERPPSSTGSDKQVNQRRLLKPEFNEFKLLTAQRASIKLERSQNRQPTQFGKGPSPASGTPEVEVLDEDDAIKRKKNFI